MSCKPPKVLGAGSALMDLLAFVPESFPETFAPGEKGGQCIISHEQLENLLPRAEKYRLVRKIAGGSAANTLAAMVKRNIPCAFLGLTGDDEEGALFRADTAAQGMDARPVRIRSGQRTGQCLSLITPDAERTMLTFPGASGLLDERDVSDADFEGVTHVHTEGFLLANEKFFSKLLALAEKHGCTVSLDFSSAGIVRRFRDALPGLLRNHVDIAFANRDEAGEFSGSAQAEKMLDHLSSFCRTAVVKLGKDGALIRTENTTTAIDAEPGQPVDTTGAGDLWQAGFLSGRLLGKSDAVSGRAGALLAKEIIQTTGARIPEARESAIRTRLAELGF